jgi:hypothetical protein
VEHQPDARAHDDGAECSIFVHGRHGSFGPPRGMPTDGRHLGRAQQQLAEQRDVCELDAVSKV